MGGYCPAVRCFRQGRLHEDPAELLQSENQYSTPWGGPDHGGCDKCRGSGETGYTCLSCVEDGRDSGCPACGGRVEFRGVCPACEGEGEITRTKRKGVSVFRSPGGLYRYLAERDVELDGSNLVELEAELSGDRDLDADCGALLVRPTKVVRVHPFDAERVARLQERSGSGA
jgi:hypothetical protein